MIRNYYTESFKGGIIPVVSATQLIDGTVKITESTTATSVANTQPSVTLVLTLNTAIKKGMYITCPTMNPVIGINDNLIVESVVHAATTTVTLSKTVTMQAGQVLTFFNVNQNSWKEYSLYIGQSPEQGNNFGSITSGTANAANAAQNQITVKVSNPYVQVGMTVYDDGVQIGVIATVTNSTTFVLAGALAADVVADSILTFSFTVLPSVSVLTIDNKTVTFTNPAQGFVLPVSVVQITSVAGGIANLIALD